MVHAILASLIIVAHLDKEKKRPTAKFVYNHLSRLMMDERYKRDCRKHRVPCRIIKVGHVGNGVEQNSLVDSQESDPEVRTQALNKENEPLRQQIVRDGRDSRERLRAVEQEKQQQQFGQGVSGAQVCTLELDHHMLRVEDQWLPAYAVGEVDAGTDKQH